MCQFTAQELCERRGGRPKLPVPSGPYGLCGRPKPPVTSGPYGPCGRPKLPVPSGPYGLCGHESALEEVYVLRAQELCESGGGRSGLPVPNSPYRLCGRERALEEVYCVQNLGAVRKLRWTFWAPRP